MRALASRNIEESIGSFALHIYAACGTTVHNTPSSAPPAPIVRKKRESEESEEGYSSSGESESEESESEESEGEESKKR